MIFRFLLALFWGLMFLCLVFFRLEQGYPKNDFHIVLPAPKSINNVAAGEILDGFRFIQPINWGVLKKEILEKDRLATVCVSILLANYGNRENHGKFALIFKVKHDEYYVVANANSVRDNAYHRFCYDKLVLEDILNQPVALVLEGIDGQPGSSITAWMTNDIVHGKGRRNGLDLAQSLVFQIETVRSSSHALSSAIILTLLCFLSWLLLFWLGYIKPIDSSEKD